MRVTAPLLEVLQVLVDAGGVELHGWAIIKATQRGGPTVYAILERLTDMGWTTARWDDRAAEPNKPRRRYYQFTSHGAARARTLLAERRPSRSPQAIRPAVGGGL